MEVQQRRDAMLKSLSEGQLLTEALKASVEGAASLSGLEELCAPFHPSRRIRPKYLSTSASSPTRILWRGASSPPAGTLWAAAGRRGVAGRRGWLLARGELGSSNMPRDALGRSHPSRWHGAPRRKQSAWSHKAAPRVPRGRHVARTCVARLWRHEPRAWRGS